MAELLDSNNAGGSFVLKASLSGMPPDACLHAALPADYAQGTVSGLLDRVFPADAEGRQRVKEHFDLRANPDLPEIYEVFLAVCEEWRDWRCALLVSAGGRAAALDAAASRLLDAREPPVLALHIEQEYRPLEYAVRHGFWESREGLLDWMRSLTVLYFLDKHEARLTASGEPPALAPSLDKALASLESQGIIAPQQPADAADGELAVYAITPEGRKFIAGLLAETESCIDQYDHFQDALIDLDQDTVEFGSGRGIDLRAQAFLSDGLDPIRTVFLLRLYDGTLDSRRRDWREALESDAFFEAVLEPAVNREGVSFEAMELALEGGAAWLEDRQYQAQRERQERELLRMAGGEPPAHLDRHEQD